MRGEKMFQRSLKVLLMSLLLALLCGISAMAAETVAMQAEGSGLYSADATYASSTTVYNQIVVPSTSRLMVMGFARSTYGSSMSMSVTLCNSKLQPVSDSATTYYYSSDNCKEQTYWVTKGVYYIQVSGVRSYRLAAQLTTVQDKGGVSKKKALNTSKNKTYRGVLAAGESASRADWFKFKVKKKQVLYLTVSALSNGYFDFYLYGPSYKKGIRISTLKDRSMTAWSINALNRKKLKVKKGTYYIKVVRSSGFRKASGEYSVKWR